MTSEYKYRLGNETYIFKNLAELMAKATPKRSGDILAGVSASTSQERVIAQMCLAEVPLKRFLNEALIPYEEDEGLKHIVKPASRRSALSFAEPQGKQRKD